MKLGSVAVTGAKGLLGREIVRTLSESCDVLSLDIAAGQAGPRSRYVDVLSLEGLRGALQGCSAVVHLAALQFFPRQERIFEVNTIGTWNVLQAARESGIRKIVLVSSECATGVTNLSNIRPAAPDYLPIDETHPLRPADAYGVSKQTTEAIGQAFARRGDMQVVVLRPTTVYAPGMEFDMRKARDHEDPYFWLYVEGRDVARAVCLSLSYEGPAYECFFVSARDTFAKKETIAFVERRYGKRPAIRKPAIYEGDPHATIYDIAHARETLGFEPDSNWRRFLHVPASAAPVIPHPTNDVRVREQ